MVAWRRSANVAGDRGRAQFGVRLLRTRAIIGFTRKDEAAVTATAPKMVANAEQIVKRVYSRLLREPETAEHFHREGESIDAPHLVERRNTLQEWLRMAANAPMDDRLAEYLAEVGRAHSRRGGRRGGRVRGRYLLLMMSIIEEEIVQTLRGQGTDPPGTVDAVMAWHKLLAIHLDMLLAAYSGVEGNAHWY